ncbi:MAG TPA: hypothetical protein VF677_12995 [Flavobacterium sp.]|jgi:hypothetical protein
MKKTIFITWLLIAMAGQMNAQIFINTTGTTNDTDPTYRMGNTTIGRNTAGIEKLDVEGNIAIPFGGYLGVNNIGIPYRRFLQTGWDASIGDYLSFYTAGGSSLNQYEKMRILVNGNVGIGSDRPIEKLDVEGNIAIPFGGYLSVNNIGIPYRRFLQTGWDANIGDYLSFYTAGVSPENQYEKMRILANGKVGIGYNAPEAKLHILDPVALGAGASSKLRLFSASGNAGSNYVSQSTWLYRSTSGSDWFSTSIHDGLSVDGSFKDPGLNTRTWWERQPYLDVQTWGNAGTIYMSLDQGKLHVGATRPQSQHADSMLSVDGKIVSKSMYVTQQNWADFVFDKEYKLPNLYEIEAYYKANKHLPSIPTAREVQENGINVGEMDKLLLQKIEELTILMVQQQREIDQLKLVIAK